MCNELFQTTVGHTRLQGVDLRGLGFSSRFYGKKVEHMGCPLVKGMKIVRFRAGCSLP